VVDLRSTGPRAGLDELVVPASSLLAQPAWPLMLLVPSYLVELDAEAVWPVVPVSSRALQQVSHQVWRMSSLPYCYFFAFVLIRTR
jgi:hypothetical protein